ncbi:stage III sporulation protein AF [Brevibacillus laterosporus]|uniref:Stage III sporulation protein AF n=1 Tax=Brevibacillus laterosporus TaxID=1465 RepID=A0AAP8U3C4_BRELA|nr:stage III sporulation protein AF [Brevibacillus laterosporus]PPA91316.1 stage III sporulation protein AF [Brevibacillus laterosporus]
MEWLNLWLRKVVLLVLLAAFLDLILPNTKIQQYVKMVMGLIILLTIMSPVFSIFQITPDELATKIGIYQNEQEKTEKQSQWKQLTQKLVQHKDAQMTQYVSSQLSNLLTEKVKQTYGVTLSDVAIRFASPDSKEQMIKEITATISSDQHPTSPPKQERQEDTITPIEKITQIQSVEINLNHQREGNERKNEAIEASASVVKQDPLHAEIAAYIAKECGVEIKQVEVIAPKREAEKR